MKGPRSKIKKLSLLMIIMISVLYITSCKGGVNEEPVDAGVFSGIPDSNLIGRMDISGQAIDINISGNYAYLTNDLGILYVIDIRDKENPRLVGNYNTGENNNKYVSGMFIDKDYAYINTSVEEGNLETSSLEIIDISEIRNPELVSKFEIDGLPLSIWIENDIAFVNVNFYDYEKREDIDESKLLVINIEDKNNPEIINSCRIPSSSWGLYIIQDNAYISSSKSAEDNKSYTESLLQIVDIGDLPELKTVGKCEIPGGAWEIDSAGDYIYVSSLSGGIYAIDVKDSNNPVIADSLNITGTSYDITIQGNYGYIADGFEGMAVVELSGKSGEKENLYTGKQGENLPPKAVIEITGDRLDGVNYQIKNPVYFSAEGAFDPNGDEMEYLWELDGIKDSDEKTFIHYFDSPGIYEVSLTVSDGVKITEETEEIKVVETDLPISSSIRHDFKVEIEYTLFNNSVENLKNINCFIRIPQTYYPYQIINDYSTNYADFDELFDNNWNSLLHFEIDNELPGGKSLTVSVAIDATVYEFRYEDIESDYSDYDKNDPDYISYTSDDLFIDSDNPEILKTAKSLTGNVADPVEIARILYNFVVRNLYYDFPRAEEGDYEFLYASEILERGKGVCSDYAILYAALLRATGIPSRLSAGIPVYNILFEDEKEIDEGHAWVEIQLPGYGWIPVDITPEDDFMSANYYLDISTEKGSGYLYENKTMDPGSYYYDGFLFSWDSY